MIHSPRAAPSVNKSHIAEVPKNNRLIFHMGGVSTVAQTIRNIFFLRCFDAGALKEKKCFSRQTLNNKKKVPKRRTGVSTFYNKQVIFSFLIRRSKQTICLPNKLYNR